MVEPGVSTYRDRDKVIWVGTIGESWSVLGRRQFAKIPARVGGYVVLLGCLIFFTLYQFRVVSKEYLAGASIAGFTVMLTCFLAGAWVMRTQLEDVEEISEIE